VNTAIVTDSTSDIPSNIREKNNIFQLPVDLTLENQTYRDGFDLSRNDFYDRLPELKKLPTTAAPSSGRFQQLYTSIFDRGFTQIISLHASKKLSGIFNAARLAAEEFSQQIKVIDSEQLSMGLGFQVLKAAEFALKGCQIDRILQEVQSTRERVQVFAMLDTFKYIHRSGRVSSAKAVFGTVLQIKPMLELIKGEVVNRGASRTRGKGIRHLGEMLKNLGELDELAVLHTNAEKSGKEFIKQYAQKKIPSPLLVNVTTIIGTHAGPNGLGFAAVVK
jgi:DegV family protein with EDD domain